MKPVADSSGGVRIPPDISLGGSFMGSGIALPTVDSAEAGGKPAQDASITQNGSERDRKELDYDAVSNSNASHGSPTGVLQDELEIEHDATSPDFEIRWLHAFPSGTGESRKWIAQP